MMDFGQLLRQTREAQELSLADVETQTRIRQRYLAALESGEWETMPNAIVGRGFLRKYAEFLGLNPDDLLGQVDDKPVTAAVAQPEAAIAASAGTAAQRPGYRPIDFDLYDSALARPQALRRLLGIILALIPVILLAFLLVRYGLPLLLDQSGSNGDTPAAVATLPPEGTPDQPIIVIGSTPDATQTSSATAAPDPTATPLPRATPTPTPTLAPSPSPTPTATPIGQIEFSLQITERAWTRVLVDDLLVLEELLEAGAAYTFSAQRQIQMRTGNAAGVTITINGETTTGLGEPAEIVDYIWTLDGGRISRATPTPEPTETPTSAETVTATETATSTVTATATPSQQ